MRLDFKQSRSIRRVTRGGDRDPAADEKDQAEAQWQAALYKLLRGQIARIQVAIEANPPERKAKNNPLGPEFWRNEQEIFRPAVTELMTQAAQDAIGTEAAILEDSFGISADWTLANAEAAAWARKESARLVRGITRTTRRSIGQTVGAWIETPGSTVGQLFETLQRSYTFSARRAQTIGVTEVTNAYSEGRELAYIEAGIPEAVFKPTAHPNCRCWDGAVLLADNTWVVVWRTNKDELVCKQPIETPWGVVGGCRGLNGRVISGGPWLGEKLSDARRGARERKDAEPEPQETGQVTVPKFANNKEAEDWLVSQGYVERAFFKGFDSDFAQQMTEAIAHQVEIVPGLRGNIRYVGNNRELMRLIRDEIRPQITERLKEYVSRYSWSQDELERRVEKEVKRQANRYRMPRRAWAYARGNDFFVKYDFAHNPSGYIGDLKKAVDSGWHPAGCDTHKSVVDHELGHIIDTVHQISRRGGRPEFNDIVRWAYDNDAVPSQYARKTRAEFLAESWAEYLNNPNPGETAEKVGTLITGGFTTGSN